MINCNDRAIFKNDKERGRFKNILERPEINKQGGMELDLIFGINANEAILTMVGREKRLHLFL